MKEECHDETERYTKEEEKQEGKDKKQNAPQEGALCHESLLIASGAGVR